MVSMRAWLVAVLVIGACSSFRQDKYIVQFPAARLSATRPNGTPWHTTSADNSATIIGGLLGLAIGAPEIGLSIGTAMSDPGGEPKAPIPYLDIKIAGETYRIAAVGRTYAPTWTQPIVIDARKRSGDEPVIVQVLDGVDNSVIAQHETTLAALLGSPAQTITNLGSVMTLDVRVTPAPARQRTEYQITVPSRMALKELATKGAPNWRPIPVWNGDTVEITASGSVCPSRPTPCFGPNGAEPGRWVSYSYDAFKNVPHAALVAIAPGENYGIGTARMFRVAQSGRVLLFVNDEDVGNNEGMFEARVVVTPAP
jgi:hypothetical protein